MQALRFIKTINEDSITISHLEKLKGKTVELIILPLEDEDQKDWNIIASSSLERAYGDDEPDYELLEVDERNPDYEAG
jgi:hypothetical protein